MRLQASLLCLVIMGLITRSLKLFASPVLCQFSFKRLFGARSNATHFSTNGTISQLNSLDNFNHTSAYISTLQQRLKDAEIEVMCCRQELITLRVNVTESQRELGQCKFQNTCYEQQLFDAEDRISYLEEALFNMTVKANVNDTSASDVPIAGINEVAIESNSTDGSTSETMQKLLHSGGATPKKKKSSGATPPKSNDVKASTASLKKASLLQRVFGRQKPSAVVVSSLDSGSKAEKAPKPTRVVAKKSNPVQPSKPVVMSEAEAAAKHSHAKSDALMITLTTQQRTLEELRRELEQYSQREGQLRQQQKEQEEHEEQRERERLDWEEQREMRWEQQRQQLVEELERKYSESRREAAVGRQESEQKPAAAVGGAAGGGGGDVSELLEDIAMK